MTTVRRSAAVLAASAVLCVTLAQTAVAGGDVRLPSPTVPPPVTPSPVRTSPAPSAPASPTPSPGTTTSSAASPRARTGGVIGAVGVAGAAGAATLPTGLYGTEDPTHDGVWRQSLAMLAQYAAGERPADLAVTWLKAQQCANGAFPTYRADPATPCDPETPLDPNATAAAVQTLSSLGDERPAVLSAVNWLRMVQNDDGGWGHRPGQPSDANSTSLAIGALTSAGIRPSSVTSWVGHHNAYDALIGFALPCEAGTDRNGGFAYQADAGSGKPVADGDATAAAVLGGIGKRMVVAPVKPGAAPACRPTAALTPERAARNGAVYLAAELAKTGHLDRPPLPGTSDSTPLPDPGSTADAIAALAASGYGNQVTGALEWLKRNSESWAAENGPAAYAKLIFAAHTTGSNPRDFGGVDLVRRLDATGPTPTPVPTASLATAAEFQSSGNSKVGILWIAGIVLITGMGIGYLISNRQKNPQHT